MKVENCQKSRPIFLRFSPFPSFRGRAFQKLYPCYDPCLALCCLEKLREDTPTSPEVIGANTLNFRPNFKFSRPKVFWGTVVPIWVCASKPRSVSSTCKNLRGQHHLRAEM